MRLVEIWMRAFIILLEVRKRTILSLNKKLSYCQMIWVESGMLALVNLPEQRKGLKHFKKNSLTTKYLYCNVLFRFMVDKKMMIEIITVI